MKIPQPIVETLPINSIKPYWRNPNRGDVAAVKASVEKYGYNRLIVLDKNHVIIVGHTLYKAVQELGYTEIPCMIVDLNEKQAKEYRIVDNKTRDLAQWDTEQLGMELKELGDLGTMQSFFSADELKNLVQDSIGNMQSVGITGEDINKISTGLSTQMTQNDADRMKRPKNVTCPHCGEDFAIEM